MDPSAVAKSFPKGGDGAAKPANATPRMPWTGLGSGSGTLFRPDVTAAAKSTGPNPGACAAGEASKCGEALVGEVMTGRQRAGQGGEVMTGRQRARPYPRQVDSVESIDSGIERFTHACEELAGLRFDQGLG